jgi:leucyl aminopeptidase
MIQLTKIKSLKKNQSVVFLADKITDIKDLSKDQESYFKKDFKKEKTQYTKAGVYTYVVNTTKQSAQDLRVHAFNIHQNLKTCDEVTIYGDSKKDLLAFLDGFLLSNYQFLKYFSDKKDKKNKLKKVNVLGDISKKDLEELDNLVKAVFWARDMVNEPVSYLDAIRLAEEIQEKSEEADNYKVDIFEQTKIESLKMGGLLAVNQGSETPATFTVIEYKPKNAKNKKPYVLVGKGIVYDTGGLSLKPTAHSMDLMKSDMGGAACMAGAIHAIATNNLPIHIIGLIPATDNRPGKNAYAPGDVVTMFDGTTIEVLNTDAEGRMVLADAIAYANKFKPELIIDAATLTGAAVRALGTKTSIIMGNAKDTYFKQLEKAGEEMHDRVVQLPFWDEWKEELKSDIADMKNLGGANAGMITAGKFLEHFAKEPYIHIDIAGPAFLEAPENYKGKGGTGTGVRLLYQFFKNMK